MTDKEIMKNNQPETQEENSKNQQVIKSNISQGLNNLIALSEQNILNYLPLKEQDGELKKEQVFLIDSQPWYETEFKEEIIKISEKYHYRNLTQKELISNFFWQQNQAEYWKQRREIEAESEREQEEEKNRLLAPTEKKLDELRERHEKTYQKAKEQAERAKKKQAELIDEILNNKPAKKIENLPSISELIKQREQKEQEYNQQQKEQNELFEEHRKAITQFGEINKKLQEKKWETITKHGEDWENKREERELEQQKRLSTQEIAPLTVIQSNFTNYQGEIKKAFEQIKQNYDMESEWKDSEISRLQQNLQKAEETATAFLEKQKELKQQKEATIKAKQLTDKKTADFNALKEKYEVLDEQQREASQEIEHLKKKNSEYYVLAQKLEQEKEIIVLEYERLEADWNIILVEKGQAEVKIAGLEEEKKHLITSGANRVKERDQYFNEKTQFEKELKFSKIAVENLTKEREWRQKEKEQELQAKDQIINDLTNEKNQLQETLTEQIDQLNRDKTRLTRKLQTQQVQAETERKNYLAEIEQRKNEALKHLKEAQEYGKDMWNFLPSPVRKPLKTIFWVILLIVVLWLSKYIIRLLKFLLRLVKWVWNSLTNLILELKSLFSSIKPKSQEPAQAESKPAKKPENKNEEQKPSQEPKQKTPAQQSTIAEQPQNEKK